MTSWIVAGIAFLASLAALIWFTNHEAGAVRLGMGELIVVFLVILFLVGAKRLPPPGSHFR